MTLQSIARACVLACLIALFSSCEKSPTATTPSTALVAPSTPARETILRVHWLGKKKISADTNAVEVMQIWNMPESAKLGAQTLNKLSLAPWRWLGIETNQASTNLFRPLLEDLISEESYIEVQSPARSSNGVAEMILAVRLDDQRADLWETNFVSVVAALNGIQPTTSQATSSNVATISHWSVKTSHATNLIGFARVGVWTVISASADQHSFLDETITRIEKRQTPFADSATNSWLEVQADLPRVASSIGRHLPASFPKISVSVTGEDSNVRTRGQVSFPDQKPLVLDPWKIPTNMISTSLTGFAAVRGLKEPLNSCSWWKNLQIGEPPNQVCTWAVQGFPSQTYFAAPFSNAGPTVSNISDSVLNTYGPWFTTNRLAAFQKSQKFNGLEWCGLPYMSPFLESASVDSNDFVIAGFLPEKGADSGPPPTLLPQLNHTNLVAYEWEMTGQRINQWLYIGQFMRLVSQKAQLPSDSLALAWLRAAALKLHFSASQVVETAPGQLSFIRNSDIGFTAIELNLLADWLESPEFPSGLYSLLTKPSVASPAPAPH